MLRCKKFLSSLRFSIFLTFALSLFYVNHTKANHVLGADLNYFCVGPNQYEITLSIYRDCNSINLGNNATISWSGSCGSGSVTATNTTELDITPINSNCPPPLNQSSCNNGTGQFGVERHVYTAIITLPPGCTDITFSWRLCCRNNAITTLNSPSSQRMYVEATLDNSVTPCNNSPVFTNTPISFSCNTNTVFYNHGAVDPDGDSLNFSLISCLDNAGVPVTYLGGFSGAAPFGPANTVTIDPGTGAISFTPTTTHVGVLCVLVEEYRNGLLIGSVIRDIQFRVLSAPCNNAPILSGVNGSGIDSIDFITSTCFGTQLCFDIIGSDPGNPGDLLTMTTNNAIPNSTFNVSGPGFPSGNQITGTFCWTPTVADIGTHSFTVIIEDDACPLQGSNTFTYVVNVISNPNDPVVASPDVSICVGDTTPLSATTTSPNAVQYTWTPNIGLSNNSIPNPQAFPLSTTTYTVTLDYNDGCSSTDFVTVIVENDPPLSVAPNNINVCGGANVTLSGTTDAPGMTFVFTEMFGTFNTIPNTTSGTSASASILMPNTPGTYTWSVEVINPITLCSSIEFITLTVGFIPPDPSCRNIYVSTTGSSSAAGTQFDPVTIQEALRRSVCNMSVIKLATGTYNIDTALNITSLLTLEGGFIENQGWLKTSEVGATTINRTTANAGGVQDVDRHLTAIEIIGSSDFRLQDLTITTDDAVVSGTSTYGIYMQNASNYNITRVNIELGNASNGTPGVDGCLLAPASSNGAPGAAGSDGFIDNIASVNGGAGGNGGNECNSVVIVNGGSGGSAIDFGNGVGNGGTGVSSTAGVVDGGAGGGGGRGREGSTIQGSDGGASGQGGTPFNPPFSGCSATASGLGSSVVGGTGGIVNTSNTVNNGTAGNDGTDGIDGVNGCDGADGAIAIQTCRYHVGLQGEIGMSGSGGSGGGGGGGGGGQDCIGCTNGTGNGGGGGGGGGAGGTGGTGGFGGGGSFGIYICGNGANGFIEHCNIISGSFGTGGVGGLGANGGNGGNGGIGGTAGLTEIGAGGNGGNGGNGGAGGNGGNGVDGVAFDIFWDSNGIIPVAQDSTYALYDQQIIYVENTNCTNTAVMFWDSSGMPSHPLTTAIPQNIPIGGASTPVTNWIFDALNGYSQPANGTFNADTTRYDSIGRYSIIHNTCFGCPSTGGAGGNALEEYRGFHNIAFDQLIKPEITSSANVIGLDTFQLCVGDFATFASSLYGDTTIWEFNGAIPNPSNVQNVPSTQFNVEGFFMIELFLITDCCGETPIDTAYLYVDPVPAVLGNGDQNICIGDATTLAVLGFTSNDSIVWSPLSDLTVISQDSVSVNPTITTTYNASVYSKVITNGQLRLTCPVSINYTVSVNSLPDPVMTSTNVTCNNDGSATATPASGIYDFVWSNGTTDLAVSSSTITSLPAGTFCVTVTDTVTGCVDSGCVFVAPNANVPIVFVNNVSAVTCAGASDGTVTIGTSNGVAPFTYVWDTIVPGIPGAPTSVNYTVSGLAPRDYTVTSTDAVGCVSVITFNVPTPDSLTIVVIDTINPLCPSSSDGRIEVEGLGGTGLITYVWSNGIAADSGILAGIDTGLYCVTVVDENNCSNSMCFNLNAQQVLTTSPVISTPITCNNGTACITVNATGGSGLYTYDWTGPSAPAPLTTAADVVCGFPASNGLYTVLVTDNSFGCTTTASVSLTEPSAITTTIFSQTNVSCLGDSTGIANVGASGGTPGYTFLWDSNAGNQTTAAAVGLPAGTYCVTVTDITGVCNSVECVTITEPLTSLSVSTSITSNFNGAQISCFGANDGEATASPIGGTPAATGYNYNWDVNAGNQTTAIATGLSFANNPYSVTVTDSLGCSAVSTVTISEPSIIAASISSSSNINCFGDSSGSATVSAIGGTGAINYSWVNGQTTATANNLPAGLQCVTVTDANGCNISVCANITQPINPLTFTSLVVDSNVTCNGFSNGGATVSPTGGTPAAGGYNFNWNSIPTQTTASLLAVAGNTYCVTVTDSLGCATSDCVTITEPSSLTATIVSSINVNCFGDSTGSATALGSGGSAVGGVYSYLWNAAAGNQTTATATGLSAGILYEVTITDDNQCIASTNISLTQPVALFTAGALTLSPYNGTDVSCVGSTDGIIVATASNGTGDPSNYIYNWGAIEPNNDSLINVAAGTYCVTVTDSLGCIATNCATVTEPSLLTADINVTSIVNVNCFGDSTGAATVIPAGGTLLSVYSILWDNGQTTAAANGLLAGNQCVTVTDANNCNAVTCVNITEAASAVVIASMSVDSNISCNGLSDAGATVVAAGGVPSISNGYNYIWNNNATTSSVTGLALGVHCVTVTDSLGCFDTDCITISEPSTVTATITSTININCFGDSSGTATVTGSGGVATTGYTYLWSSNTGNQTTATATGLKANITYCVTITDNNGCSSPGVCVVLTQPTSSLVASASEITSVTCFGASDGIIQASSVGGSAPVTYQWDANASSQNTQLVSGLLANTYCVTITDSLGCIDSACVILTEPAQISISATSITNIICRGDSTGEITLGVSGGNPGYSFQWDATADSLTTPLLVGLSAGTYCVVVTDASGCQDSLCTPITEPASAVDVSALVTSNYPGGTPLQCFGDSSGTALATITGGSAPYAILWDIGSQTTAAISGLPDGSFCVLVTDSLGCSDTACISLVSPVLLTSSVSSTDVLCRGDSSGTATVTGSGGTGGYTFLWDTSASSQTTATATGLAAGVYPVTTTDANGCFAVSSAIVGEPATGVNVALVITSNYNGADVSCNGTNDATINASASGGSIALDYSYIWSGGFNSNPLVNIGAGPHCVTVTDDNGCSSTDCITVSEPSAVTATIVASTNVACFGTCTGTATAAGTGGTTITGYNFLWDSAAGNQTTQVALNLCAGSYNVTVTDANGCSSVAVAIIGAPASALTTSITSTSNYNGQQVSCSGASDGELTATVAGGTGPGTYIFSWSSNSSTTNIATGLSVAGNSHCVFVQDSLGCTDTACFDLIEPIVVSSIITNQTDVTCNGGANGSATVSPSGGTGAFTYNWDNGDTTSTATALIAGPICVTATDANGCSASTCTNIAEPTLLTTTATINSNYNGENISCAGACDGVVFATATGGTLPYLSYTWSTSGAGILDTMTVACVGPVDVIVTDANGCTATAAVTLTEPSAVTATITANNDATCNGQCDGDATVVGSGGTVTTGYTYLWSVTANNQTTATATGLCAGTHTVTVSDNNGCSDVTSVFINQPALGVSAVATVTSNYNGSDVTCIGDCDGEVTAIGSGGTVTTGYTFLWDANTGNQTTAVVSGLCAGVYTVTVSDNGGCSNVTNVTVSDPSQVTATIVSTVTVSCGGGSDGEATVVGTGGTIVTGYSFLWDATANNQTTATATGLPGGTGINVTVTDANGCSSVSSVTITQPVNVLFVNPVVITNYNGADISCNGACDGAVEVQITGGIPGYSIVWNTSATTDTISNLCPGTYIASVTDNGGCVVVDSVVVTEPNTLGASISSQINVSCTGFSDGCVTIQGVDGTSGYTYSIVSGTTQANNGLFCGLSVGTYTVTVTDLNLCSTTVGVTITEPSSLPLVTTAVTSNYLGQDISCFGACDAEVTATSVGGTPPYSYNWSMTSQTTSTVTGICAGVFSVIITDSLGCTASASVTVTQPPQLTAGLSATTNALCFGDSTGEVDLFAAGGTAPYTYDIGLSSITTISTSVTLTGLVAGGYTATITDGNGCQVLVPFTITSPPLLTNTASVTSLYANGTVISCNGACDGAATSVGAGGNPGSTYDFLWSTSANNQTTFTATGLCAGTHSVTITDQNGCIAIDSVTLTDPPQLIATSLAGNINCFGDSTGSVQVTAVPGTGTPNYSYSLGSQTNLTGLFTGLAIGTYCVTVTDANNCSVVECVTLTQNTLLQATAFVSSNYNGAQTSCSGSSDGEATVNITGGQAAYNIIWDPATLNQTTATATGLSAGTYYVTVTDFFGCTTSDSVSITSPDSVSISIIDTTHILCFGQPTGSFTVAGSGGVGSYTYSVDGGITFTSTVQYNNLPANMFGSGYCVIVQDGNGCQATACVNINEPPQLQGLVDSIIMVSCFGGADGIIALHGLGGIPPYTYSFNGGLSDTTRVFEGLNAGTYSVVITDANGCQTTMNNLIITQPAVLILNVDTSSNPSCTGVCDGIIQVSASQGTPGYEFSIDGINYQATGNFTNLCAGGYTLYVRDAQGCITTTIVTLTQPSVIIANPAVTTNFNGFGVSCTGDCNGAVAATPSGGTPSNLGLYSYQWSTAGATTQTLSGLCANIVYIVTVTDANGCIDVDSIILTEPTPLTGSFVQVTNESCFGNDGIISVVADAGSGVGSYTYDIGSGPIANGTFTNLNGSLTGTQYSITITDGNGCSTLMDTFLTIPAVLDITSASVTSNFNGFDISCFGAADGSATIIHTGGSSPISYLWDLNANSQTTISATGLRAGTYGVTITDIAGCTADTTITLTQPTPLTMSATTDSAGCDGGSNGTISVIPAGSIGPAYTYAIDSIGTGIPGTFGPDSIWTNLTQGTYTVYVQDSNGCGPVQQTVTIGQDAPITIITNVLAPFNGQQIACNGDSTGTATASATGGSLGGLFFAYQWDINTGSQTGTTATGLPAGIYFVTVTDTISNCSDIASVTIVEPSLLVANIDTTVNVACFGQATGAVQVSALAGTPSYTYSIDFPAATQNPPGVFTGLPSGTYTVTATDLNTCTATVGVTIQDADSLEIDLDTIHVSCFGMTDGLVTAEVTGGTPYGTGFGYTVTWSPSAPGAIDTLGNLTAGIYTMTVQDAAGCVQTATATVVEPSPIIVVADSVVSATCAENNGLIRLQVSGGPSANANIFDAYEFSIDGGATFISGSNPLTFSGLTSGFYDIVVRDTNFTHCIGVLALDLGSNSNITGSISVTDESCFGYADGTASVTTSSTAGGYTYVWTTNSSSTVISTSQTATGLAGGTHHYIVTVTDADGCQYIDSANIVSPDTMIVTASLIQNVNCYNGNDGAAQAIVIGRDSSAVTYLWSNGVTNSLVDNLTAMGVDTSYTIIITDTAGCVATDTIDIRQPLEPVGAFMTGNTVLCANQADGIISLDSIAGGTPPYLFSFSSAGPYGSTSILSQGLASGIYSVYIQDANGCIDSVENIIISDTVDYVVTAFQDQTITLGQTVTLYGALNNTGIDSSIVSWSQMDPNSGLVTHLFTGTSALVSFTPDTFYTDMQFIINLNNGCGDSAIVEILVNPEESVYVPNAFSPNGDGINDIFTVYGSTDVAMIKSFMVFDRWGELVHLGENFAPGSTDPSNGWDGIFNGQPMNPAVFVFYVEIEMANGETVLRKGDVTLVR